MMKEVKYDLDWKNQYYENDYTTQSNLQIKCSAYQITNGHTANYHWLPILHMVM